MKKYLILVGCMLLCAGLWMTWKNNGMFRSIVPSIDDEDMQEVTLERGVSESGAPLQTYPSEKEIVENEQLGIADEDMPEISMVQSKEQLPYVYRENIYSPLVTSPDTEGSSPFSAVSINHQDEQGITKLMRAVGRGDLEAVRMLIDQNADLDLQDKQGRTALMYAVTLWGARDTDAIVKLLVEKGADWSKQDIWGHTVYYYVQNNPRISREMKKLFSEITFAEAENQ